jgi:aspartate 1-decarboxylase
MKLIQALKSKLHMGAITGTVLEYSGSVGIDSSLISAAGMLPGERVQVLNFNNGERIETYIIEEPSGSGIIALYGPAARCAYKGDRVSIISYLFAEEDEIRNLKPKNLILDENNRITNPEGENDETKRNSG